LKEHGVDVRPNKVRGPRQKKPQDGSQELRAHEFFQLALMMLETLYNPRYTNAALFHDFLVIIVQNVLENRHDISNCSKRFFWDISATVRSCRDRSPLRTRGEEVQEGETGCQTTLTHNRGRKLNRDLLQCLWTY
jgi:hypothetical protein